MQHNKIFILGLPRTGTTSICAAMLSLGYSVAHTAYTKHCFEQAQVIADTPIFHDFIALDKAYPNAKFIYLQRPLELWLPSIKQLLLRMQRNVLRQDGGFNPIIKRCYLATFAPFTLDNIQSDRFLSQCFQTHQARVKQYFQHRPKDLLSIDISEADSYAKLCQFLQIPVPETQQLGFKRMNIGGKVTAWKEIDSPLKVESTTNGRITPLPYDCSLNEEQVNLLAS